MITLSFLGGLHLVLYSKTYIDKFLCLLAYAKSLRKKILPRLRLWLRAVSRTSKTQEKCFRGKSWNSTLN
jgi:hypothetical protein